jgi:3-mercaptopyruvate sulfurtransferase SseA
MEQGYRKVYALKGGWDAWMEAEYPVEEKAEVSPKKS